MKKFLELLVLGVVLPIMTGCVNDFNLPEDGNHRSKQEKKSPVMKTFRMTFGGDFVSESEEPLLRADDKETYAAINVYRAEKISGGGTANREKYAYGLFKGKDDISINLETGYVYDFEATILVEDRDRIAMTNNKFEDPFLLNQGESVRLTQFLKNGIKTFIYHAKSDENVDRPYFSQLKSGTALVNTSESETESDDKLSRYPRVKRFYGKLDNIDPAKTTDVVIPMDYKSFGLKFQLDQIPDGTYVTVKDITTYTGSDPGDYKYLVFTKNLKIGKTSDALQSWDGIFSLDSFTKNSQTFKLRFSWIKLSGSPETFEHEVTVNAKRLKVLTLKIEGDPGELSETKSGNIKFTMDDRWEDSSAEDTEIVTNVKKTD